MNALIWNFYIDTRQTDFQVVSARTMHRWNFNSRAPKSVAPDGVEPHDNMIKAAVHM